MQDLSSIGLMPEEWGGDTPMIKVLKLLRLELFNISVLIYLITS